MHNGDESERRKMPQATGEHRRRSYDGRLSRVAPYARAGQPHTLEHRGASRNATATGAPTGLLWWLRCRRTLRGRRAHDHLLWRNVWRSQRRETVRRARCRLKAVSWTRYLCENPVLIYSSRRGSCEQGSDGYVVLNLGSCTFAVVYDCVSNKAQAEPLVSTCRALLYCAQHPPPSYERLCRRPTPPS